MKLRRDDAVTVCLNPRGVFGGLLFGFCQVAEAQRAKDAMKSFIALHPSTTDDQQFHWVRA
jgi:hypothetical protein